MTRNTRVPRLCKRRSPSTGKTLAYATFNGRTVSFGSEGPLARQEYEAFLSDWLANGRRLPEGDDEVAPAPLTVGGLIDLFLDHLCRKHDDRWIVNNYPRAELPTRPLRGLFGSGPACEFSPKRQLTSLQIADLTFNPPGQGSRNRVIGKN